jgi:hypothetical protein
MHEETFNLEDVVDVRRPRHFSVAGEAVTP